MRQTNMRQIPKPMFLGTLLLLVSFLCASLAINAQVTIGSGEPTVAGALLQVKDKENIVDGTANASKGLALPRVNLSQKNQLFPMFLKDSSNPTSDPNDDYAANKASIDQMHTGLIVYNLVEDDDKELCLGLNQWDGAKWNCFESKLGNAVVEIGKCDSLTFEGIYQNEVSLNASNYMTIPLHVTKAGAYNITAMPDPSNGYYFTTSGVFLATGYYFLSIPGAGTPTNHTVGTSGDLIKITANGKQLTTCDPLRINVKDSSKKPLYTMDCNSVKVKGVYKVDQALDPNTNYIELKLNVDAAAVGATYLIETNTVDGISFKDQGLLTSTSMTIQLKGTGIPTSVNNKYMTLTSNSQKSVTTCNATVVVVIPKKKMLVLGYVDLYGWVPGTPGRGSYEVLTSPNNFGQNENSIVKTEGFDIIYPAINGFPNLTQTSYIMDQLTNKKVDICYIGQDIYAGGASGEQILLRQALIDFVNKKGVLVLFWEANPSSNGGAQVLFRQLFSNPNITQSAVSTGAGAVYKTTAVNDDVLNGPFGDVRNKYWGEDASWAMSIANLPSGEIDVYSWGDDYTSTADAAYLANVTGFKHKSLNLVYFGDGGFCSSVYSATSGNTQTGNTLCPFNWDPTNMFPTPKPNYGKTTPVYSVYNSTIWANTLAWALKQAQFNGINTP